MALTVYKKSKAILNIVACLSVQYHLITLIQHCITIIVDCISFNLDDILNSQMMPVHVFLLGSNDKQVPNYIQDFLPALQVMAYHRKMMQQFMASDYLTKQILNWKLETNDSIIRKRVGKLQNELNLSTDEAPDDTLKKLLFDNGSSNYNAWLKRTTTLDDIRHQLTEAGKVVKGYENRIQRRKMNPVIGTTLVTYLEEEECDDGDITGYAYSSRHEPNYFNPHPQAVPLMPRLSLKKSYFGENPEQISKTGYDDHTQPEHSNAVTQPSKQIKEISLKDITDIALTTLAFLSFGMFILQVLMCITMSKDESNNLMMLPMEATEAIDTNDGTEEIRRRKRSILQKQETLLGVNQLSQILLMKIDHLYLNEHKNSNSAFDYKKLCKYSAFLRTSTNNKKNIWTTLYSLGASWLAARLSDDYLSMIKRLAHVFNVCA